MNENFYCVVMAGGIGSRFWPASTKEHPKQFLDILGTGKTLLQQTFERFTPIIKKENFLILTNEDYFDLVLEQLPMLQPEQIVCEPARRNTAPCILYAANKIYKKNPNASFVVAPSDHLITNESLFQSNIQFGLETAQENNTIVTLGITPTEPSTGYGYINYKNGDNPSLKVVKKFVEKPDQSTAIKMIDSGDYLWNSGIFIWKADYLLNEFKSHQTELYQLFSAGSEVYNTAGEGEFIQTHYPKAENISVDYAILEKTDRVLVIPGNFGWSDLGSWGSLKQHIQQDKTGNGVIEGKIMFNNAMNNLVLSSANKATIISGLQDFIVIDTDKALLICPLDEEQKVKQYVEQYNSQIN